MSKKYKLLEKVRNNLKGTTMDDLLTLMKRFGFYPKRTKHTYFFKHDLLKNRVLPNVTIPHGGEKKVKRFYVNECLNAIEQLLELLEED